MKKLLYIVLQTASRQNSSDCIRRTLLSLNKMFVMVTFWAILSYDIYKTPPCKKFNSPVLPSSTYLLRFGWAQGDRHISLVGTSNVSKFAWTPWLLSWASVFVAVSLLQRTSLSLAEEETVQE